ncbi:GNAT family N-acetyltransferase [Rubrobacter tropicus]|uniref:GNAT family N-acetyltransferase n=1 Tax=Rubrobacter tropicus TaxID=2653851 RepID=A0A6G8QE45_9ACTN|nr:GNAT family N-acetyltransferase [Rubrobacter tropicus]QIN84766.1 GNAT family N-acetyltransferase [Rubrobacter tropicus]
MKFRELRESDHAAVVAVVDGWWGGRRVADKLPRLFFRLFRETSFAVEEDGELVAFLVGIVGSHGEEAYVHFVGVHPGHRPGGLGRRLYEEFFGEVRRRGCRSVRAITSPVNKGSVAFHGRMGFEVVEGDLETDGVSVHSDYDGDGKEKVLFRRDLR